jgi:hypothetical protein
MDRTAIHAVLLCATSAFPHAASAGQGKKVRGPFADLRKVVIWGRRVELPGGGGLSFGGLDQRADDARPHTRILRQGRWVSVADELRSANALQADADAISASCRGLRDYLGRVRFLYFEGLDEGEDADALAAIKPTCGDIAGELGRLAQGLRARRGLDAYEAGQVERALRYVDRAVRALGPHAGMKRTAAKALDALWTAQVALEKASEALDAEPPPRAIGALAHDSKTGLYVLFGGDHFDYMMNDTWVFDPKRSRWMQRHPAAAPSPRGDVRTSSTGDGRVTISGGIEYMYSLDSQYRTIVGESWAYDVGADRWTGPGKGVPPDTRTYRTGAYRPAHFWAGARPSAGKTAERLNGLPDNTWVYMRPPRRPVQRRDWGTIAYDPHRDVLLQWSGGHSAHPGTDVPHYHLKSNTWELPIHIENPLGFTHQHLLYPNGWSFNRNPWMTGHTYKSYAYHSGLRKMIILGRTCATHRGANYDPYYYLYDPSLGAWTSRHKKHGHMCYGSNYYTLAPVDTPRGMYCWAAGKSRLLRLDTADMKWRPVRLKGELVAPGADASGVVYDPKRTRLLFVRKPFGKLFAGQIQAVDLESGVVSSLSPTNMQKTAGHEFFFVREACYLPKADLFLWGEYDRRSSKTGRMFVYDPAGNRWGLVKIAGRCPGMGWGSGLAYDRKRDMVWNADNHGNVWAMRPRFGREDVLDL